MQLEMKIISEQTKKRYAAIWFAPCIHSHFFLSPSSLHENSLLQGKSFSLPNLLFSSSHLFTITNVNALSFQVSVFSNHQGEDYIPLG